MKDFPKLELYERERFHAFPIGPLHWVEWGILKQRRILLIMYLLLLMAIENKLRKPMQPWYSGTTICYVGYLILLEVLSRASVRYHTTFWRAIRLQSHLVITTLLFHFSGATHEVYLVYLPWAISAAIFFRPGASFLMATEAAILASFVFWPNRQLAPETILLREALLVVGLIGTNLFIIYLWQRWIVERQARNHQIETLKEVGNAITAAVGLQEVFETIFNLTRQLIPFETALILGWDPSNGIFYPRTYIGYATNFIERKGFTFKPNEGLTGWVATNLEPLLVRDVEKDAPVPPKYPEIGDDKPLRSYVAVPLAFGDELLGIFELTSDQPNTFNEEHLEILDWLADQISIAMRNAGMRKQLSDELRQTTALHRLSVAATSHLDALYDLLQLALDTALQLTECSHGWISLVENKAGLLKVQVAREIPKAQWHVLELGRGVTGWVAKTAQSLCVADVREPIHAKGADTQPIYHTFIPETRSELCVPLKLNDRVLGVINIESPRVGAFDRSDLELLETLANQASVFIHRANLLRDTKRQLEELTNLYDVSLAMAGQTLDVKALLQMIVERAAHLLDAHGGGVLLSYPEDREVRLVFTHNLDVMRGRAFEYGEGMAGRVVETGKPLIVNDYHAWAHRVLELDEKPYRDLLRAVIQVPLKWQDQVIGVLAVSDNSSDGVFEEKDRRLLERFANHAALTIGNARMHSYLQKLVSSSPNAIIAVDTQGTVTQFNEASERILEFTKEEILDQFVAPLYYDGETEARKINRMLIEAGEKSVRDYLTYVRNKNEEKVPISFAGALLSDEFGGRIGSLGIMTDLRKERRLEIEKEKSDFLAKLERFPQDISILNTVDLRTCLKQMLNMVRDYCRPQYVVIFASVQENETVLPAIACAGLRSDIDNDPPHYNWRKAGLQGPEPWNRSRDEILRREAKLITAWSPSEEQRREAVTGIRGGKADFFKDASCVIPQRLADNYRSVMVFGPFPERAYAVNEAGFLKNINLTIATYALSWLQTLYLRSKQKETETSARLIVHRTRMNLIQVIGKFGLIKRQANVTALSYQAAEDGEKLVKQLSLSVRRALTTGVIEMEPEDYAFRFYSLATLVLNCVESFREEAGRKRIELRIAPIVESLPYADVDPTLFSIALGNLVDNAIKYSFEHTYIRVRAEYDTKIARIFIEDLGEEFPEEARANLREPGHRWAVSARARRIHGMGMGLWEASVIAGVHGGKVDFISTPYPGRGRTAHHVRVWIELPLQRP